MPKLSVKSPSEATGSELNDRRKRGRNSDFVSKSMAVSKKTSGMSHVGYTGQDRRFLEAIRQIRQHKTDEIMQNVNADTSGKILYQSMPNSVTKLNSE